MTTPAIVLNDVPLGRFEIRLEWLRLGEQCSYRVIALEPDPAAKNCEVTHPHVYGEHLCEGDAKGAIAQAVRGL